MLINRIINKIIDGVINTVINLIINRIVNVIIKIKGGKMGAKGKPTEKCTEFPQGRVRLQWHQRRRWCTPRGERGPQTEAQFRPEQGYN